MRRIIAKRESEYLKACREQKAKCYVAKKLQSHYRRRKAFGKVQKMRLNHNAKML